MKATRRLKYALLAPAFLVATVALQFVNVQFASAAALTWTGGGNNNNFSTGANWSTGAAPQNGDSLTFSLTGVSAIEQPFNDLNSLSLSGITVSGQPSDYAGRFVLDGNNITLTGNIANSGNDDGYGVDLEFKQTVHLGANISVSGPVTFYGINTNGNSVTDASPTYDSCGTDFGVITGAGAVNVSGSKSRVIFSEASPSFSGAVNVSNGAVNFNSPATLGGASRVTLSGTGSASLYTPANISWSTPFTFGGTGNVSAHHGSTGFCAGTGPSDKFTSTLTGGATLTSNFSYSGSDHLKINDPYTSNGFSFTVAGGSTGTLTTPQGSEGATEEEISYDGDLPNEYETVGFRQTATLNGTRNSVNVNEGGTLKGNGGVLNLYNAGTVAPGNSPGALTVLQSLSNSGLIEIELKDKTAYDQLKVGANATEAYHGVSLNPGSKLAVSLYEGYSIERGDQFTIIDNLSSNAVVGTFDDLAEGAQITISGITFSISYVGGDGNDVVLTALSTGTDAGVPNTGAMSLELANPAIVAGLGIVTAAVLAGLVLHRRRANQ